MTAFDWVAQLLGILAALLVAPLFLGWVNQCRAWLQNKSAPPLMLPYRGIYMEIGRASCRERV